jgi:hypothetical protein
MTASLYKAQPRPAKNIMASTLYDFHNIRKIKL